MGKQKISSAKRNKVKKSGNIFDAFAKKMLGRIVVFVDFLHNYADPKFVSQIDLVNIRTAPTHYFGQTGEEQITDLVFQCPLKDSTLKMLAIIIFEHQSGSIRDIPRKLLKYISAIWDAEEKAGLPLSVPYFIVLRTGKKPLRGRPPQMSDRFPKSEDGTPLGKSIIIDYDVIDLPAWNFKNLVGGPVLRCTLGMLWKMTGGDLETWPEAMLPISEILDARQRIELSKDMLDFVAKAFQANDLRLEIADINKALKPIFHEKETNMILTVFEEKFLEGQKIGEKRERIKSEIKLEEEKTKNEKRLEEAKIKSRIETILLFLSSRFNGVTKKLEKKIQKIDNPEKLNELAKLAAKCESLKEFEKALD